MIPQEKIMEIIYYTINEGMKQKNVSVSINLYSDNLEISFYPTNQSKEE